MTYTLQAKLVSCQFDTRWVTGGNFNCPTSSTLSKTMHVHCTHCDFVHRVIHLVLPPHFLALEFQLIVAITWSRPPSSVPQLTLLNHMHASLTPTPTYTYRCWISASDAAGHRAHWTQQEQSSYLPTWWWPPRSYRDLEVNSTQENQERQKWVPYMFVNEKEKRRHTSRIFPGKEKCTGVQRVHVCVGVPARVL